MIRKAPVLAGGAAAVIAAGALQLFPPFDRVEGTARPGRAEFTLGQEAFAALLSQPRGDLAGLESLGFTAGTVEGADDVLLVSENSSDCAGRGTYWLRKDGSGRVVITAPHRGSDRHTGTLAAALFLESGARAAAWNSAPRNASETCPHAIDVAREKAHLFSAFALGFADAVPDGLIVQLHGFDGDRRQDGAARDAGMIVSNGTQDPGERLFDIADCLSLAFSPRPVLVYPGETRELGALTNAQGQLLREAGFEGFVHIEISLELRAAMIEDAALRAAFAGCLNGAAA